MSEEMVLAINNRDSTTEEIPVESDEDEVCCIEPVFDEEEMQTFIKIRDTFTNLKINLEKEVKGDYIPKSPSSPSSDITEHSLSDKTVTESYIQEIIDDILVDRREEGAGLEGMLESKRQTADRYDKSPRMDFTIHTSIIFNGDRLDISKQLTKINMKICDVYMFNRTVAGFVKLIMGTYTREDLITLRRDHDSLIRMWNGVKDDVLLGVKSGVNTNNSDEKGMRNDINELMKTLLETPTYYTTSCTSLIACGILLRNLYEDTCGKKANSIFELLTFIRSKIRHVDVDPFACDCEKGGCSSENKLLLSMILEIPCITQNQNYIMQILAYLMYNNLGREEIFIVNIKNTISPGLIDKIPVRTALMLGTLEKSKIKKMLREVEVQASKYAKICGGGRFDSAYGTVTLNRIICTVSDPRIRPLINSIKGLNCIDFTVDFPPCQQMEPAKAESTIVSCKRGKCCGKITVRAEDLFVSSISLCQLLVYACTHTKAPDNSRQHYYVRDIILNMAKTTLSVDTDAMLDAFGYIDRTDMFTGFENNPLMTSSLQKLISSYIDCINKATTKYENMPSNVKRKANRKFNGPPSNV